MVEKIMEQDYPTFIKFFVGALSENIESESRHQKLDFEDRPDIIIDKNLNIVKVDEDWNYTAHDEMWGSGSSASWLNRQWGL